MLGVIEKHKDPDVKASGWSRHPETIRFAEHKEGEQWLYYIHDVMVVVMHRRWPDNGHADNHQSPVADLTTKFQHLLVFYEAVEGGMHWQQMLDVNMYPRTKLEEGTPWERDGVSKEWYLSHMTDWSWKLVEQVKAEGGEFAEALAGDVDNMTREADVVMAGDGRAHLAAKETKV
jgi:hypothetical protein